MPTCDLDALAEEVITHGRPLHDAALEALEDGADLDAFLAAVERVHGWWFDTVTADLDERLNRLANG